MTIQEYEQLTGITVASGDVNRITAIIRRCESKLGTLLGYSLSKQKTWTELGEMSCDGLVPFPSLPVSDDVLDNLLPPQTPKGKIQLFNFDELDKHIRINPAKEVYRVMVVLVVNEDEFITIQEMPNSLPYLNPVGLVVAITRYAAWFTWAWWRSLRMSDKSSLMLAVDGDFVNVLDLDDYDELAYLLADMVTYYADPNYSLMGNIRSESIDSHSYSRAQIGTAADGADGAAPEGQASAKRIIEKYAGPGAFRKLVR